MFLQPQHLSVPSVSHYGMSGKGTLALYRHKKNTHYSHLFLPASLQQTKLDVSARPWVHVWWGWMLLQPQRGDTGVQRGPPASGIRHRGQTGGRAGSAYRHVPRGGLCSPPLTPTSLPLAAPPPPPLWGLPFHTTRWGLDLSFNERYPSGACRRCGTAVALSTSHCGLLQN